jgi:hypothetical protein
MRCEGRVLAVVGFAGRGCSDPGLRQWGARRRVVPGSVCPTGGGVRRNFVAAMAVGALMPL